MRMPNGRPATWGTTRCPSSCACCDRSMSSPPFVGFDHVLQHQPRDGATDLVGESTDPIDLLLRRDQVFTGEPCRRHLEYATPRAGKRPGRW